MGCCVHMNLMQVLTMASKTKRAPHFNRAEKELLMQLITCLHVLKKQLYMCHDVQNLDRSMLVRSRIIHNCFHFLFHLEQLSQVGKCFKDEAGLG